MKDAVTILMTVAILLLLLPPSLVLLLRYFDWVLATLGG